MTIPRPLQHTTRRLTDAVREMFAGVRHGGLPKEEASLGVHLRGNRALYESLVAVLKTRIEGRALQPEPTDPLVAKSMIARDREIQWAVAMLERVFTSPTNDGPAGNGEPPA